MAGNSKNALLPYRVINTASMGGDVTGTPTNIQFLDNVAIQLNFTGTPTGTFTIQGSLDYAVDPLSGTVKTTGNWIDLVLPSAAIASGAAGNILLDMTELSFPWVRIKYTRTSGTGTLDAYISAKAV